MKFRDVTVSVIVILLLVDVIFVVGGAAAASSGDVLNSSKLVFQMHVFLVLIIPDKQPSLIHCGAPDQSNNVDLVFLC